MQISAATGGVTTAAGAGSGASGTPGALGGLNDAWSIGDTLTANDKKLVGWDPIGGKVNPLADALSFYRHKGLIKGEVPPDFVDALKNSIANKGGYPLDPSLLMTKSEQQNLLSPQTQATLIAMMSGQQV
jgi:hypothetical protein